MDTKRHRRSSNLQFAISLPRLRSTVYRVPLLLCLAALSAPAHAADRLAAVRNQMVDDVIIGQGVTNKRVIEVMRQVPRHEFMSRDREKAYFDMAVPIGEGQTISPPFVVASMTEHLDPQPGDKVLEIGTGSGYQAAVLSGLVKDVYTIEIQRPLGERAEKTLTRLGYKNVHCRIGDGFKGWAEAAPFDKIIVTCSPEKIPQPLIDQLAEGGRMMIPVGQRFQQVLYLYTKKDGKLEKEAVEGTMFVPMTGEAEDRREVEYDSTHPAIANGSFERSTVIEGLPDGWYYARQCKLDEVASAPDGRWILTCSNQQPGKFAQILQAFGVDGRKIRQLEFRLWVRGVGIRPPLGVHERRPALVVSFYDANRAPLEEKSLGPWTGTFPWVEQHGVVQVPREARLAVVYLGMLGSTGEISFDNVSVTPVSAK